MKVLSIGSDRKLFEEGSAVRLRTVEYADLFDELHIVVFAKRNFQFSIFNFQSISKIKIAENCWIYPTNSRNKWFYIWDAIRIGKKIIENYKLKIGNCVVTSQDPFECGFVASKIARRFKLPLHVQIHADFLSPYFVSSSLLNRLRVFIASRVLPRANAIRVVSQRIKDSLSKVDCQMSKVSVLPIFTDLEKFQRAEPSFDLKQKYSQWNFIILAAARLSPEKNIGFALRILSELVKKHPKIGLVIVGEGSELPYLKLKTKNYNLQNSVAFEGWQSDLVSYYKTAHLFLQTSLYEGYGLALLEAAVSGCPAVSSDVGIAPELLKHQAYSFVCPVNNLKCFVAVISQLIEDRQLRNLFATRITLAAASRFVQTRENYLAAYRRSLEAAITIKQSSFPAAFFRLE